QRTEPIRLVRRELGPDEDEPMQGADVAMLEEMLWQLGVSPSTRIRIDGYDVGSGPGPGITGQRLPEGERSVLRLGTTDGQGRASVGLMLGRFNYFSHWPLGAGDIGTERAQTFIHETVNDIVYDTLDELRKHWTHYLEAYDRSSNLPRFLYSRLENAELEAAVSVFDGQINYPRGNELEGVDPTYTVERHEQVRRYHDFERADILRAIANKEASGIQWGGTTPYRITVGGADESGSSGFNQIQNRHTYGGRALDGTHRDPVGCIPVSAYDRQGNSQVNHYDPGQNIMAIAVWLAGVQGSCGRSFRLAFRSESYSGTFHSPADTLLHSMRTGSVIEAVENGAHTDDTYELLAKAIGGYNQGAGIFDGSRSWVEWLIQPFSELGTARRTAMRYAIDIMHSPQHQLGMPYRAYIWRGGTYPEGHEQAGGEWCFAYGEREWMAGSTWEETRDAAFGDVETEPSGRMACEAG
ncbi:hypothetical protein CAI21_22445, partial [Alkalilimnicola ehrlichii]